LSISGCMGRTRCCGWVKEASYPDKRFQERLPFWIGTFFVFVPLGGYYIAPCLLISRHVSLQPWVFGFVLCCYTVGIFLHYVGDAQKYYTLRLRSGLIEDGLFARTRNPNYLGETLIYISFAILSWHWLPFLVLGGLALLLHRKYAEKGSLACPLSRFRRLQSQDRYVPSINSEKLSAPHDGITRNRFGRDGP
jgi:steroid 5-alpha reductase family enzyme